MCWVPRNCSRQLPNGESCIRDRVDCSCTYLDRTAHTSSASWHSSRGSKPQAGLKDLLVVFEHHSCGRCRVGGWGQQHYTSTYMGVWTESSTMRKDWLVLSSHKGTVVNVWEHVAVWRHAAEGGRNQHQGQSDGKLLSPKPCGGPYSRQWIGLHDPEISVSAKCSVASTWASAGPTKMGCGRRSGLLRGWPLQGCWDLWSHIQGLAATEGTESCSATGQVGTLKELRHSSDAQLQATRHKWSEGVSQPADGDSAVLPDD